MALLRFSSRSPPFLSLSQSASTHCTPDGTEEKGKEALDQLNVQRSLGTLK